MPFMARYDPFSPTFDHPLLNSSPDFTSRNGSLRNRAVGAFGTQSSFRERSKRLQEIENDRQQLVDDLIYQLEAAESQLNQLRLDHSRESQYNRDTQLRETQLQDQLRQTKVIMDRNAFVVALVDGDGTVFTKDLLSKGETGGKEAATLLARRLNDYATQHLAHLDSPKLVARIYADTTTLADNLISNKVIDQASALEEFIRGFNSTKLLFDFVDAGTKKDSAGDKLSEHLRLSLYDCHCHQVILGCSHNSEYAEILQEASKDSQVLSHLTLLEGVPFEKDIAELLSQFKTVKFDDVFSTTKLAPPPMTKASATITTALPALARIESNKTNGTASAASTPSMNWATVTAQAVPVPATTVKPAEKRTPTPSNSAAPRPARTTNPSKTIDRNRLGQRLDRQDTTIPNYEIQRVKKLKLCNIYYLQGTELCTSNYCSHRHDYPLTNYERKVLREVARMTPCYYKTDCDDPDCIYGHRCPQSKPNEPGCYYGEDCRFHGWGHGIDIRIVKTTKV